MRSPDTTVHGGDRAGRRRTTTKTSTTTTATSYRLSNRETVVGGLNGQNLLGISSFSFFSSISFFIFKEERKSGKIWVLEKRFSSGENGVVMPGR